MSSTCVHENPKSVKAIPGACLRRPGGPDRPSGCSHPVRTRRPAYVLESFYEVPRAQVAETLQAILALFERCAKDPSVDPADQPRARRDAAYATSAILDRRRHSSAVEQLFRKSPHVCAVLLCLAGRYKRAHLSAIRFRGSRPGSTPRPGNVETDRDYLESSQPAAGPHDHSA